MAIRYAVRVAQLGSAALLMGAACDGLRLPARPANTTVAETTSPPPAPKSNRAPKRTAKVRSRLRRRAVRRDPARGLDLGAGGGDVVCGNRGVHRGAQAGELVAGGSHQQGRRAHL